MSRVHQYLTRDGRVMDERLAGDRMVRFLYSRVREHAPSLFKAVTSHGFSDLMGMLCFDVPGSAHWPELRRMMARSGFDPAECLDPLGPFSTARELFERRIRYQELRPLAAPQGAVASPCDARVIAGTLRDAGPLLLKDKFFAPDELLGPGRARWADAFRNGDAAVFRLTPDRYHYCHAPVSGFVVDVLAVPGSCHSCHPGITLEQATPMAKNSRHVTVIQSDARDGTGVGLVAMVEVVALLVGEIVQRYSATGYDDPQPVKTGLWLDKGQPKSLFRPGSSSVVLLFQEGRVAFAEDLLRARRHGSARSLYGLGFGNDLVETDVTVRSLLALRREQEA